MVAADVFGHVWRPWKKKWKNYVSSSYRDLGFMPNGFTGMSDGYFFTFTPPQIFRNSFADQYTFHLTHGVNGFILLCGVFKK